MKPNKDVYKFSIKAALGKLALFDRYKNELIIKREILDSFLDDAFHTYLERLKKEEIK